MKLKDFDFKQKRSLKAPGFSVSICGSHPTLPTIVRIHLQAAPVLEVHLGKYELTQTA